MPSPRIWLKVCLAVFLLLLAVYITLFYAQILHTNDVKLYRIWRNDTTPMDNNLDLHSYSLWKATRLNPEDKSGNASHRRYGDPLQLYSLPGQTEEKSDNTGQWIFSQPPNELIDCRHLFVGEGIISDKIQKDITVLVQKRFYVGLKHANESCDRFIHNHGYITTPLTQAEASFPIAYSLLVYKDVEQFELLLRTIYRPQNVYCVHIDKKSSAAFRSNVTTIAGCFSNIFVTSRSSDVKWGEFSVLEPEINCLKELLAHRIQWKYFINLTGQEMPLRTNRELVKILTSFDGANNVETVSLSKSRLDKSGPPPHGVMPSKGAIHVILSRLFVDFLLHNKMALDVLDWSRKVKIPDEILFSTLNYNERLAAPGSYRGVAKTTNDTNPSLARLKNWASESSCHGKYVREVCIFGTKDLPLLATREELFANKAYFHYHPEVLMCMQELLYNRTADEYNGFLDFNVSYYASRDFVKHKF